MAKMTKQENCWWSKMFVPVWKFYRLFIIVVNILFLFSQLLEGDAIKCYCCHFNMRRNVQFLFAYHELYFQRYKFFCWKLPFIYIWLVIDVAMSCFKFYLLSCNVILMQSYYIVNICCIKCFIIFSKYLK